MKHHLQRVLDRPLQKQLFGSHCEEAQFRDANSATAQSPAFVTTDP
jgi:hypothetical protein